LDITGTQPQQFHDYRNASSIGALIELIPKRIFCSDVEITFVIHALLGRFLP